MSCAHISSIQYLEKPRCSGIAIAHQPLGIASFLAPTYPQNAQIHMTARLTLSHDHSRDSRYSCTHMRHVHVHVRLHVTQHVHVRRNMYMCDMYNMYMYMYMSWYMYMYTVSYVSYYVT